MLAAEYFLFFSGFKTNSDTEVLLKAYQEYGEKCVDYFIGMWAFAIADLKLNYIFLSRDRLGIKPLFYYHKDNQFIFSTDDPYWFGYEIFTAIVSDGEVTHSRTFTVTVEPTNNPPIIIIGIDKVMSKGIVV